METVGGKLVLAGLKFWMAAASGTGLIFENQLFTLLPPNKKKRDSQLANRSDGRGIYFHANPSLYSVRETGSHLCSCNTCDGSHLPPHEAVHLNNQVIHVLLGCSPVLELFSGNAQASLLQEWLLTNMNPHLFFLSPPSSILSSLPLFEKKQNPPHTLLPWR